MITNPEYTVRWFKEVDLDYYMFHLNNSLYNQYDEERFQWKFLQSPYKLDARAHEEEELLEDEILLYYDEEDEGLLDDEDEEA